MLGSLNKLGIDAGHFCVKSVTGSWKNAAHFSGKVGNISTRESVEENDAFSALHQSIKPIYKKDSIVYTAIGIADTIIREVEIPAELAEHEIEGAIEIELSDTLPFTLDQVYFDFCPISHTSQKGTAEEKTHYLVAVSHRDGVDTLTSEIQSFDKKELKMCVDVDAYAYSRLVNVLYGADLESHVILLVDVGHQNTRFYFYDRHGLVFHREQQIGGKFVTDSIAEVYDIDEKEAMELKHNTEHDKDFYELVLAPFLQSFSEQVGLALDFFEASGKSEFEVGKVVFTGGGICLDGFFDALANQLDCRCEIMDVTGLVSEGVASNHDPVSFSANYALALALLLEGTEK